MSVCVLESPVPKQNQTAPTEGQNLLLTASCSCNRILTQTVLAIFVSRMIEESGKRRRTMAEKRQLFMEMSK